MMPRARSARLVRSRTSTSASKYCFCGINASTSIVLFLAAAYMAFILYIYSERSSKDHLPRLDTPEAAELIATAAPSSSSMTSVIPINIALNSLTSSVIPSSQPQSSPDPSWMSKRRVGFVEGDEPVFDTTGVDLTLATHIKDISFRDACRDKPVFMTMAKVKTALYWDLIENFLGAMSKFSLGDCALMICISDERCLSLCAAHGLSCFDYRHSHPAVSSSSAAVSAMEEVATVKLLHAGIALEMGAHIFLLDLDVGFLRDPMLLCDGFFDNPLEHVRSQMDVGYSHYKHNNEMYTHPRPNFGAFLVKSHKMAVMAFRRAWQTYQKSTDEKKQRVATDQNALGEELVIVYNIDYFAHYTVILYSVLSSSCHYL